MLFRGLRLRVAVAVAGSRGRNRFLRRIVENPVGAWVLTVAGNPVTVLGVKFFGYFDWYRYRAVLVMPRRRSLSGLPWYRGRPMVVD